MVKFHRGARVGQRKPDRFGNMCAEEYQATASEADIQAGICDLLTVMRIEHSVTDASIPVTICECQNCGHKQKVFIRKRKVGKSWPDITGVLPGGRALLAESKAARTRFQPGQNELHERLRAAGALMLVPRSVDEFREALFEALREVPRKWP